MARGIVNQIALVQPETTPGVAATNAMRRLGSMKIRPKFEVGSEDLMAQGYKVPTAVQINQEWGSASVDAWQDFNAATYILESVIGAPVGGVTTPGGGVNSRQRIYELAAGGVDARKTYTVQFGDATKAIQMLHALFQTLGMEIKRGGVTLSTSMLGRKPTIISAIANSGIVTVPAVPIPAKGWDFYADDTWAGIGVTKLLTMYQGNLDFGDKFVADWPINSANPSFEGVVEAEDQSRTASLIAGFGSEAEGLVTSFTNNARKFFRFQCIGPIIEAAIAYTLQIDYCSIIKNPGEVGGTDSVVTLPFDLTLAHDPTSDKILRITLINTVATL